MGKQIKELEAIVAKRRERLTAYHAYKPEEKFTYNGNPVFSVLDFWQYAYSQLDSSILAEFLVARALEIKKAENVDYWTAYDMSYRNKRIEVKSTTYVHPWNKQICKVRTFSIEPSDNSYWEYEKCGVNAGRKRSRQSEVYVFCLNRNMDIQLNNPLKIDDWIFYVIPTFIINNYCKDNPDQKRISLNVVRRLSKNEVTFDKLKDAIDTAIEKSDQYYDAL